MKTVTVTESAVEVHKLLDQARNEDILVRASDGAEFLVTAIDEFDQELARTRQNAKLMSLLDERAKQSRTISLNEVKRQLGLAE
jgi:hypothetical protein